MMEREKFKSWFSTICTSMGVTKVEFRKLDTPFRPKERMDIGSYNIEQRIIWVIEEWTDRYLPTRELIYYSLHELGHHLQLMREDMPLNEDGMVREENISPLEKDAHLFASIFSEPLLDEKLGPLGVGHAIGMPLKKKMEL